MVLRGGKGGREREEGEEEEGKRECCHPTFISHERVLTARSLLGALGLQHRQPPTRRKIVPDDHGSLVNICQVNSQNWYEGRK